MRRLKSKANDRTFFTKGMGSVGIGLTDAYGRVYVVEVGGNLRLLKDIGHGQHNQPQAKSSVKKVISQAANN